MQTIGCKSPSGLSGRGHGGAFRKQKTVFAISKKTEGVRWCPGTATLVCVEFIEGDISIIIQSNPYATIIA
jgi:hypothetical protein